MFGAMTVLGPAQAKLYAWRMQGGVFAGVVVKMGLRWEGTDQRMVPAGAVPVIDEARHHKNNFAHSPIYPSDVVPYRPYADLIVDATAHPQGDAATVMPRIVLERAGRTVIDKRLLVQAEAGPVPLRWERTHRGADNPFGGIDVRITDPRRPETPAGFGPEPGVLKRQRFPKAPDGLVDLPEGTSADVFQAAPPDQRCEHFDGSEWLTLEGMHPEHAHLRLGLPALRAQAVVAEAPATTWSPLRMAADLLAVQPSSQTAVMTWRGWLAVSSVEALPRLRWVVTLARADETVAWPSVAEVAGGPEGARATRSEHIGGATADGAAPVAAASPFAISAPGPARPVEAPLPGAPWETHAAARPVVRPRPGDTTAEPASQPDPFEAALPSEAASTVGVHTEEPATKRPADPFSTHDDPDEAAETTEAETERGARNEAAAQRHAREEEARAEAMRREVAAREAEERARFEAEEAERRRQSERQARLEAERERRERMMSRLYGFKLQDP